MEQPHEQLALAATRLATALPGPTLRLVARLICESDSPSSARGKLVQGLPHPQYRSLVNAFLTEWQTGAAAVSAETAAMTVLTAAIAEQSHRDAQAVELVWTGPDSEAAPFRRTEQAILQVLDSAQSHITLVSYAVYRIPFVCEALVRAARRGVAITVILETPDRVVGENEYNTLKALGPEVAACSTLYFWPKENRPVADNGKVGILHVKCAVADGRWLFLSSANLTEYAFSINMELGLLVTGGSLPQQVTQHFEHLVASAALLRL